MRFGMSGISSLGDCLYITPALQALKGQQHTVEMELGLQSEQVAKVFDGLADVVFMDNPTSRLYITNQDKTHSAQRVLNSLGLENHSCIPKINLKKEEINWAKDYLKQYNNCVCLVNDNLGGNDKNNPRAHYVRPPIELMQYITDYLIKFNYTVLQIGVKKNYPTEGILDFTPLKGVIHITNLNLREQAACFSVIKKIISGDSGLYHLNLAVGGKSLVFHPPESKQMGYEFWDLHYLPELWKNEIIRCKYIDYTKFDGNLASFLDFLNG